MALSIGIVGLPNVGKSTLFNALSEASNAEAANYPFCTIEPNVGMVPVPDDRLPQLAKLYGSKRILPTTLEFVDIAGLVRGASKGEGLGNQFLSHIRQVDAICHVLRCFEDPNVIHVDGSVDPARDAEVIDTELALKDLESVEKRLQRVQKDAKAGGKVGEQAKVEAAVLEKVRDGINEGKTVRRIALTEEERALLRDLFLLTNKPVLYVANVAEGQLSGAEDDPLVAKARAVAAQDGAPLIAICADVESQIQQLPPEDRAGFLEAAGLVEPGLNKLVRAGYKLLQLVTYITAGEQETRAWTIHEGWKAPQAAGVIHTDFERGFIKAEVCDWRDLVKFGSEAALREKGLLRIEGKEYVVKDGDVMHFRFNV
ncbi:redox-regulated ATPase YchF [Vulgatibacter incomptus]|uniref:Ribosome-binding ATPase YchF n=1 Tax=Vulgatibacter incomptus TaxID=1391653 RepID=A0A0K1PHC9_9BACT|nr:redox-regulated ATPase YchF [Vulgatibacter incomptus]AKU92925.1 GTP-binding and nucleic acid-binding protein YchF [Vulgatibacter incomptus]